MIILSHFALLAFGLVALSGCIHQDPPWPHQPEKVVNAETYAFIECQLSLSVLDRRAATARKDVQALERDGKVSPGKAAFMHGKIDDLFAVLDAICDLEEAKMFDEADHNRQRVRDVLLPEVETMIEAAAT